MGCLGWSAELVLQQHKIGEPVEAIIAEQGAMAKLSIDTKAGRRIGSEKLARLKEIISHLQAVVDWAEILVKPTRMQRRMHVRVV